MNQIGKTLLRGAGVILPVTLTIYFLYALAMAAERAVGSALQTVLPASWYWPGFGLVVSIGITFVVGLLVRTRGFDFVFRFTDWLFNKMPVVRSVYSTLQDFADFMTSNSEGKQSGKPVRVEIMPDTYLIGILTNEAPANMTAPENQEIEIEKEKEKEQVVVYLPMSYQIGGYSIIVPKNSVTPIDMPIEQAMRFVVTAGIKKES